MTKEDAFDMQAAAQRAGVKSTVFIDDSKAEVRYGIKLYKASDLYKVARALEGKDGPEEVALFPGEKELKIL